MSAIKATNKLAISMLLAAATCTASAEGLADGNDWVQSTPEEHVAFVLGLSNLLSAGYQYDEKNSPGREDTFSHRVARGLRGTTVIDSTRRVSAWYKAHPDQLDLPVIKVLWNEIAKPHLAKSK